MLRKWFNEKSFENFKFEKTRIFVVINNQNLNVGIFTDGDLKRLLQKRAIDNKKIKNFMTKNPYVVEENMLATEILSQMNRKKLLALLYIIRVIKEKQLE